MNRKTDLHDLDIPKDDVECWDKYPKHRWVYNLERLLDAQSIKWSPFFVPPLWEQSPIYNLHSLKPIEGHTGNIFVKKPEGNRMFTEVYISKGEIKYLRHIQPETGQELATQIGEVELRLNAFVTLYFIKFTGVISAETYGNEIYGIKLRPMSDLSQETNVEVIKLIKRIYKRSEPLSGLTDRALQEHIAS